MSINNTDNINKSVMTKTTLSSLYGNNIFKNISNSYNSSYNDFCNNSYNDIYAENERLSQQKFLNKYNITNATFTNSKINFLSNETIIHIIHSYYAATLPFYISSWKKVAIYFQDELDHYLHTIKNEKDNRVIFHSSNTRIFTYNIDPYYPNKNFLKEEYSILSVNLRRRKSNSDSKFIFSNSIDNNINLLKTYKDKYLPVINNQLNTSTSQFDNNYIFKMPINKYTFYIFIPQLFHSNDYFIYLTDETQDVPRNTISSIKGYYKFNTQKDKIHQSFIDSCNLLLNIDSLNTYSNISLNTSFKKFFSKNKPLFLKKIEDTLSHLSTF